MSEQRFRFYIHDRELLRVAEVGPTFAASVVLDFDQPRGWTLALAPDTDAARALTTTSRLVIEDDRERAVFSGPVRALGERSQGGVRTTLAAGIDDTGLLGERLALPTPGQDHQTSSGQAETVAREKVRLNLGEGAGGRRIDRLATGDDLALGLAETVASRYGTVREEVAAALVRSALGVRLILRGRTLWLEIYAPLDRGDPAREGAAVFAQEYGTLGDYEWRVDAPEVDAAYGGGQGQGAGRTIRTLSRPASIARWGATIEDFLDARDTNDPAIIDARLDRLLTERGERTSVDVELREGGALRFGVGLAPDEAGFGLGDLVAVQLPGRTVAERIRRVTIGVADGKTTVTPEIGAPVARSVFDLLDARERALRGRVNHLERSP